MNTEQTIRALIAILSDSGAESAEDRDDDLCAVYVRCDRTEGEIARASMPPEKFAAFEAVYGSWFQERRTWKHSWLRRKVRRGGVAVYLSREEWLHENALAILRSGGTEARLYGQEWRRFIAVD